jgi:hypothetical protein
LQVFAGIIPRARQISHRLIFRSRGLHGGQQPGAAQLRQLARIAAIRFDSITRLARNQRRRDHIAADTRGGDLPLERVTTRARFIEHADRAWRLPLELTHEATHGLRFIRNGPRDGRGLRPDQHRHEQVFLVRINPDVRSNLFHDRLLSMRLWRREALTRDFGGTDHLVECDSTTTLR